MSLPSSQRSQAKTRQVIPVAAISMVCILTHTSHHGHGQAMLGQLQGVEIKGKKKFHSGQVSVYPVGST